MFPFQVCLVLGNCHDSPEVSQVRAAHPAAGQNLEISTDRGSPLWTPIYYDPYYGDSQERCPKMWESSIWF